MATPSRSRSSGRGEDDNFEWRLAIERRQLASERQLKLSLQETERLREENVVLRIQASTSGPPRRQRSRGQVANSRRQQEPESIYPGTKELSQEHATLGPQEPGRSRPPMATTWAPRPDPMVTPMVQNVHPHRDPVVTPVMRNVHSHPAEQPTGRNLPNEPPIGSISRRLDDMLSTPFCSHIIHYEPPRGFLGPVRSFRGTILVLRTTQANISTLQNIKMQDNESLREFVKRFGQAVLQVEACSMDVVLQIFKRSICPGTPFFESLAKSLLQR
ncbi:hypothetical protein CK203_080082 [Vitis vinifera]|uniref:Retrotransposon gag domain-containing protein n=1 Tax=Vitis vinifera TaxID=29760 RepID=A0A438D9Q0_VITVI|nr:hypothetical protein CK203_080082 [Vitis vinifera]